MKNNIFTFIAVIVGFLTMEETHAGLVGSTYTLDNASSFFAANGNVVISTIVPAAYNMATLIVSNAAAAPITVSWAAPGHAVGIGTTNQLTVPAGQIAAVNVNAAVPGLLVYSTQMEQIMPVTTPPVNSLIPELLYYKMTEGAQAYVQNSRYFETPPVYLADSSQHGGTTGTVTAVSVPIEWVANQNGTPASAIHYNGASTVLDAGPSPLFNFTTNLFSINVWIRNLTYPCAICGNGTYLNSGWYMVINPAGAVVMAAENPGVDRYVATTSTVAFTGNWCMITVVRTDTNTILIYRNGVLQNTIGTFANPAPCNNDMILGDNYYGNHYDGDIGTVRIYSHPLTPTEINALYLNDTTAF